MKNTFVVFFCFANVFLGEREYVNVPHMWPSHLFPSSSIFILLVPSYLHTQHNVCKVSALKMFVAHMVRDPAGDDNNGDDATYHKS